MSQDTLGKLVICATPIGNLGDITLRALEALRDADVVYAEDTRVTGKLLAHFDIAVRMERCDQNVITRKIPALIERVNAGEQVVFASDAGTPGISDPGMQLVEAAQEHDLRVEVIPGASAVLAALVASGFSAPAFYFGGFLPRKEGEKKTLLTSLGGLEAVLVFYESPHRTVRSLAMIAQVFPQREVVLARELTKLHEEVVRAPSQELSHEIAQRTNPLKGEVVLVVGPPVGPSKTDSAGETEAQLGGAVALRAHELTRQGNLSRSQIARALTQEFAITRKTAYEIAGMSPPAAGSSKTCESQTDTASFTPDATSVLSDISVVSDKSSISEDGLSAP